MPAGVGVVGAPFGRLEPLAQFSRTSTMYCSCGGMSSATGMGRFCKGMRTCGLARIGNEHRPSVEDAFGS